MRPSRVRAKWNQGQPALCVTVHLTDPSIAEMASTMGFDCLWIDLEHHGTSVETAANMMRGARVGSADVMARPGKHEMMRMGRLLEMGAHGILYPRCESGEEAREVVRWAKFAPVGERGFDGGNADNGFAAYGAGDYVPQANEQTWLAVQIESPNAVEQATAMAAVEGVDLLFFGPGDYSVLTGRPGRLWDEPDIRRAAERVSREARAAGKRFGSLVFNQEQAQWLLSLGASLVCYGCDLVFVRQGLLGLRQQAESMGFALD